MAQPKPETIKKLRGQLYAAIRLLDERGVSHDEIVREVKKVARVEFGSEADTYLRAIFAPESDNVVEKAAARGGDARGALIGSSEVELQKNYGNVPRAGTHAVQWVDTDTGKVEKSGGIKSTLNDGLNDQERARAAAIRKGA